MGKILKNVKSLLCVVYTLFGYLVITNAGNVPVMIWHGVSSSNVINPLQKTSISEFEEILSKKFSNSQPPMILFVKDNFCIEDIKYNKQNLQQLSSLGSLTYLTSVESAISVFENLSVYNKTIENDLESVAENEIAIVQVDDLHSISEIYNILQESSPNLVVALTGKSCSYTTLDRIKRAIKVANNITQLIISHEEILFYADSNPLIKFNKEDYVQLEDPTFTSAQKDNIHYNLKMIFKGVSSNGPKKINLKAQFNITNGYFKFLGFQYQPDGSNTKLYLKSKNEIYFPFNFSYHCYKESIFTYKNKKTKEEISLKILNLQVQMDANKFSDAYDCVGFMSIPIWTGIFVTAILAIIMIWGLTMIMDIRTMDRFDDPKGKTITISTQE